MRIAVFGAGGVGGYFGGRLAQAGQQVVFIARGKTLEALRTRGLKVDSPKGDFVIHPVQADADPASVGVVDAVLVAVKSWQVPEAARTMRPLIGPQTFVVPLQNGVEAPAQLVGALGAEHVLGGLCGLISMAVGPGHIRHAGADPFVSFAELDHRPSERTARLQQAFARARGLTVEVPPDIHLAMWRKFLLIVSWSGIGAITRAPVGVFRELPETREMLRGVMQEVFAVARARDIMLAVDIVAGTMTYMDSLPPDGTASMQRDILEGRPSELEAQTGAVVRMGREAGVQTPLNAFIYHSLLPSEMKARGRLEFGP